MPYIDSHVHIWTDDYQTYPFAEGIDPADADLPTFHVEDILGHARPSGVDRVVLVQMSYYGTDNRYMLKAMGDYPDVFGGIGIVDWDDPGVEDRMTRLAAERVYGFRVYPKGVPPESWCDSPGFERMFAAASRHRLAVCPLIGPDALPALARRCEQFPGAPVIIDHLCLIGAKGPILEEEVDALCAMARFESVMVKVSAFYALGEKKPPYHDLAGLIRRVVDAYGPQRLMWASDGPYQMLGEHTYAASVALMEEGLDFLSAADRAEIMTGTAERFFFR